MHSGTGEERKGPRNFMDYIALCVEMIMVVLTALMVLLVSYQVFERYVLQYTPPWSEELSVYLMIWFGIIGIAVGVRKNAHMALNYFADRMPRTLQTILVYIKYVLILIYSSVLLNEGVTMVMLTMSQRSPAIGLPVGYVYLALPVSMVLIIIFTLEAIAKEIRQRGKE